MCPSDHERVLDADSGSFLSEVTHLEMRRPPSESPPTPPRSDVSLRRWPTPALEPYLELFRRVGTPWLWFARLTRDSEATARLLAADDYAVWRLWVGSEVAGLCELNHGRPGEVKIEYFGLVPEWIGQRLGGYFLRAMVHEAWRGDVRRVWLHTCSEDHPDALALYQRVGFEVFRRETEWVPDPRLTGLLPRHAAPHVPLAATASRGGDDRRD